ncbi:MAG: pyrimidine/purine nucleoside phosphorylase [Thermodesulfobacteriota bacterium]
MSQGVPAEFSNVTAVCKANLYFGGKVVSHTLVDAAGKKITLGIIFPGTYTFSTGAPERMDVTAGECRVRLAGSGEFTAHPAGTTFFVPGDSSFEIVVDADVAEYVCTFG